MYRRIVVLKIFLFIIIGIFTAGWVAFDAHAQSDAGLSGEVRIGSIMAVTGELEALGLEFHAAERLAVGDFNRYLAEKNAGWSLKLVHEDAESLPPVALEKIESLHAQGIPVVLGPLDSASLQFSRGYIDSNQVLAISCCSTSTLLAIPNDTIFRMSADDSGGSVAITSLFNHAGIDVMVPVWRGDTWGIGYEGIIRQLFASAGGVVDTGVRYNPSVTDFSDATSLLAQRVQAHVDVYGPDNVAVFYMGFGEIVPFIQRASEHDILDDVRWFAADPIVQSPEIVSDQQVLRFVTDTMFTTLQATTGKNDISRHVHDSLLAELGMEPIVFSSSAYDSVWIAGLAMEETQSTDPELLRDAIPAVVEEHMGALGSIRLNDAGDLAYTNYDVWTIADDQWTMSGSYNSSIDELVLFDGSEAMTGLAAGEQVVIGGVLPLTGDASMSGEQLDVAIEYAEAQFNQYLEENGMDWSLEVVVADSQTSPDVALDQIGRHHANDIRIVVGPYSSAELAAMKDYADSNGMVIVSPSSTAPALAIPGDNVFRLIPDDTQNGYVFAKLFEDAGVATVIPIWRGDTWGDGLVDVARESFAELGGSMDEGIRYGADTTNFSEETAALSDIVRRHMDGGKTAVLALSFQEIVPLIQTAMLHDNLDDVSWFVSSGTLFANELIDNPATANFMRAVNMTGPQFESLPNPTLDQVNAAVSDGTGRVPIVYVAGAYDAVWILGLSILESGSAETGAVLEAMPGVLEGYDGALGQVSLNEAGDLEMANYGIYRIQDSTWDRLGGYEGATGMITIGEAAMHDPSDKDQITIGGIVPLTGDASLHGQQLKAAMKHAEAKFNQYLEENNIGWNLDVVVADSQTSPDVALDHLARQHADGISAVVGPYSSAELAAMKDYADSNEMIIISPSSSAPSLAIPGDNVFRLIPDDTQNGHVFAKLFEAAEMETVIPMWRGDIWGDGLVGVARESFAELGGSMDDGVRYDPDTTDFSADVAALSDIVRRHMDAEDDRKIGVLVLSFQEVVPLIQAALLHDNLDDVVWFGSSTPANDELIDPAVIEFVHAVQISSPRYELFPNPTLDELNAVVSETTGQVPLVYVAGAYDAVWILGLSILESGSAETGAVLEAMPDVLDGYDGALGQVSLNEAGDLATISYGIYQFEDSAWQSVGTYDGTTDTVTLDMPPETGTGPDTGSGTGPSTETVPEASPGGGCLIATAAYGSELAPNVQMLREIRDGTLLSTASGTSFVTGFSQAYYSFSPAIADLERENPAFRDAVRMIITPGVHALGIMALADPGSEASVLVFGLLSIGAVAGIYVVGPAVAVRTVWRRMKVPASR